MNPPSSETPVSEKSASENEVSPGRLKTVGPPLAAVIGWPVGHSLSPFIHRIWSEREGREAYYAPVAAPPSTEDFERVVNGLRAAGYAGVNVTLPHKERAFAIAGGATRNAAQAGAANMLTFTENAIIADNSDIAGFAAAVEAGAPGATPSSALLLGAGGAARAVVIALIDLLSVQRLVIANRSPDRAETLVKLAKSCGAEAEAISWPPAPDAAAHADIIVNATNLGMDGAAGLDVDLDRVHDEAVVCDIVYGLKQTPLLDAAKARGLRTADGLDMLMHQAVPGYKTWLGETAVVDADLRARLEMVIRWRAGVSADRRDEAAGEETEK